MKAAEAAETPELKVLLTSMNVYRELPLDCCPCCVCRAIGAGDEGTSDVTSLSAANASIRGEEMFESASQVGSSVSYPQWDPEGDCACMTAGNGSTLN